MSAIIRNAVSCISDGNLKPCVDRIGDDHFHPHGAAPEHRQDEPLLVAVLDAGGVHERPRGSGRGRPRGCAACGRGPAFPRHSREAPFFRRLDGLRVDDRHGWLPLPAEGLSQVPPEQIHQTIERAVFFQMRKYQYTVAQCGRSCGRARHWHPVRATYSSALRTSRRSCLAGRPPVLGAGMMRSTWPTLRGQVTRVGSSCVHARRIGHGFQTGCEDRPIVRSESQLPFVRPGRRRRTRFAA